MARGFTHYWVQAQGGDTKMCNCYGCNK
jgi:hypothetical protein